MAASGGDLDLDGYEIVIDAVPKAILDEGAREGSFYLPAGTHVVSLGSVADNCTVTGPNPRSVNLALAETVTVQFDVVCVPTGVMITAHATGADIPQAFVVFVDTEPAGAVVANDSLPVGRLTPGDHVVTLRAPEHCTVSPSAQITVSVSVSKFTSAMFDISCVPVVRLEKIAYTDETAPYGPWINLVNSDGTGEVQLHQGAAPAWSHDGRRLAFSNASCVSGYYGYPPYCTAGLVVVDPEIGDVATPIRDRLVFDPSWSPTGESLVVDYAASAGARNQLATVKLSSPTLAPLTVDTVAFEVQPAWSPDGNRIAFVCSWTPRLTSLCIVNADGSGLVRLTDAAAVDRNPAWSPDGTIIAFARYPAEVSDQPGVERSDPSAADLDLINVVTRKLTTLTKGGDPAWSPDGSKLVFAGGDGLFIIDADGTNRRRITTGAHYEPAWRP